MNFTWDLTNFYPGLARGRPWCGCTTALY